MSTKVKLVILGKSGANPSVASATMDFNMPGESVPKIGDFIAFDERVKFLVCSRKLKLKSETLSKIILTVKPESNYFQSEN